MFWICAGICSSGKNLILWQKCVVCFWMNFDLLQKNDAEFNRHFAKRKPPDSKCAKSEQRFESKPVQICPDLARPVQTTCPVAVQESRTYPMAVRIQDLSSGCPDLDRVVQWLSTNPGPVQWLSRKTNPSWRNIISFIAPKHTYLCFLKFIFSSSRTHTLLDFVSWMFSFAFSFSPDMTAFMFHNSTLPFLIKTEALGSFWA